MNSLKAAHVIRTILVDKTVTQTSWTKYETINKGLYHRYLGFTMLSVHKFIYTDIWFTIGTEPNVKIQKEKGEICINMWSQNQW